MMFLEGETELNCNFASYLLCALGQITCNLKSCFIYSMREIIGTTSYVVVRIKLDNEGKSTSTYFDTFLKA